MRVGIGRDGEMRRALHERLNLLFELVYVDSVFINLPVDGRPIDVHASRHLIENSFALAQHTDKIFEFRIAVDLLACQRKKSLTPYFSRHSR